MSSPAAASTTAAVEIRGLSKTYGSHVALDDVTLTVPPRGVYGLVGPNGAGKTTLLSSIASLHRVEPGTVVVRAERVAVAQDVPEFEPWLTAREVVALSAALTTRAVDADRVAAVLERVGLAEAADRRCGGFSRGMAQRLTLAATVITDADLYILDEPASALDPAGRSDVLELVAELGREATVVFSSHILADVERVADTVAFLDAGRIIHEGPLRQLLADHVHPGWHIRVSTGADRVVAALRDRPWTEDVTVSGTHGHGTDGRVTVTANDRHAAEADLITALAATGAAIVAVEPVAVDLERVFLALTGKPDRPGRPQ